MQCGALTGHADRYGAFCGVHFCTAPHIWHTMVYGNDILYVFIPYSCLHTIPQILEGWVIGFRDSGLWGLHMGFRD